MKLRLSAIVLLVLLFACEKLREESTALEYDMKSYKIESLPGCASDTVACATFEVEYPHFSKLDTLAQSALTERINYWLGGAGESEVKSMQVLGNDFIRDFAQFVNDMPDYGLGWYYKATVTVLIASDSIISLQVDTESFTGGAHGSYTTNFVNIEPQTGTAYLLDALLRPGYIDALNRLGEENFRRQRSLDPEISLESAGFNFPSNQFKLNDNYGFRKEGIVFFFNSYEIAPYSEGPTEFLIPYEELGDWMK